MNIKRFEDIYNSLKQKDKPHPLQTNKDEMLDLVNIVEKIKPQRIMEIGSLIGGSLKFWEQLLPPKGLLISLDQSPHILNYPAWNLKESDRDIRIIIKDSLDPRSYEEVKKILGDNNYLDFLYIDGCHDIKHTLNDFQTFGSLVRQGGIIGFDDVYNVEGGTARTLFPLLSHANEWIMPTLNGVLSGIDHTPYTKNFSLYTPLRGKCMVIFREYGIGIWWKE